MNRRFVAAISALSILVSLGVSASANAAIIHGTNGNDVLNGTSSRDQIYGKGGTDIIKGFGGNDDLYGEGGSDDIAGNDGNDWIEGGGDYDGVRAPIEECGPVGQGAPYVSYCALRGGPGNDQIWGNAGQDIIDGGADSDRLDQGYGGGQIHAYGDYAVDAIYGGQVHDFCWTGGNVADIILEACDITGSNYAG